MLILPTYSIPDVIRVTIYYFRWGPISQEYASIDFSQREAWDRYH